MPPDIPPFPVGLRALYDVLGECVKRVTPERSGFLAWENCARYGILALECRLYGVRRHFDEIHNATPRPLGIRDIEYQLASLFFHMQSSIETLTYALNGLGSVADATFRSPKDAKALARVEPRDVYGTAGHARSEAYARVFPNVQRLWIENSGLLELVRGIHNRSKHRTMTFAGGDTVSSLPWDDPRRNLSAPWKDVVLRVFEGVPVPSKFLGPNGNVPLVPIVEDFAKLVNATLADALEDVKANVLPCCTPALDEGELPPSNP